MWRGLIVLIITLAACSSGNMKPKAAGAMYDVVVAADDKRAEQIVKDILEKPVEGLPQSEPWFNVMTTGSSTLTNAIKYARAIVVVRTMAGQTKVRYERDAFAKGQTIVYITYPSAKILKAYSPRIASLLVNLLDKAELESEAKRLSANNNEEARKEVLKTIGCPILVPEDVSSIKVGRNFVWLSNDGSRAMKNICVYTYPATTLSPQHALTMRDSIMKANIEGEEKGMYMQTEPNVEPRIIVSQGKLTMRGLWIMRGDAMGGPFVSISLVDSAKGRTVVAEGFVYAPESKKKILIKQLEAAINTLRLQQ